MILVRTVFNVKWGKMDEVLAGMAQMRSIGGMQGRNVRMLTDLSGPMFTLVQEMEFDSVDQWQQQRQQMFNSPEWQRATAQMPEVFESGRTEFYNIHEV